MFLCKFGEFFHSAEYFKLSNTFDVIGDVIYSLPSAKVIILFPALHNVLLVIYVKLCAIWYHLYNYKKREKHPWSNMSVFHFFKIIQMLPNPAKRLIVFFYFTFFLFETFTF